VLAVVGVLELVGVLAVVGVFDGVFDGVVVVGRIEPGWRWITGMHAR
jgi:hypothetical protein